MAKSDILSLVKLTDLLKEMIDQLELRVEVLESKETK